MIEGADSSLTWNSSRGLATKPARIQCSNCNCVQNSWSTFPVNDCRHNRSCCNATTPTLLFWAHLYTCRSQVRSFCMASSAAPLTTDLTAPKLAQEREQFHIRHFHMYWRLLGKFHLQLTQSGGRNIELPTDLLVTAPSDSQWASRNTLYMQITDPIVPSEL
jgi:hypothetical protein